MEKKEKKTTRDTSYSKTGKVIDANGLEKIKTLGTKFGMNKTGRLLHTSPYTIRYIAQKYGWKRPASKCPHLVEAVKSGRKSASFYKTLDFSGINLNDKNGDNDDS